MADFQTDSIQGARTGTIFADQAGRGTLMLHMVRQMLLERNDAGAVLLMKRFLTQSLGLNVRDVSFHQDHYSLNSVRGFVQLNSGTDTSLFFKFHQEEKEEETVGEYYRAHLLSDAGFPVDLPVHINSTPGEQIVLYPRHDWKRLSDVCLEIEANGCRPADMQPILDAQKTLDEVCLAIYLRTLHKVTGAQVAAEPVLQLFTWRLFDHGDVSQPGGRVTRFYADSRFSFPGLGTSIGFEELCRLKWIINGVPYRETLGGAFAQARALLAPDAFDGDAGITAHGDAHNANVWYVPENKGAELIYYDPAFAGNHLPAVLAEAKSIFHNIFAHPDWLYHSERTGWLDISAEIVDGMICVNHNWALNPLRAAFLQSKADNLLVPLFRACREMGGLPQDWRRTLRSALFCCPTLVMNLTAGEGSHSASTSLLGWTIAVMLAGEPKETGIDPISNFLDYIEARI
jgi:hypothetical protein